MSFKTDQAKFTFNQKYDDIRETILFDPRWANGTGYFDNAIIGEHKVRLKPGDFAKSLSDEKVPRSIILVGTLMGTVVVFEHHSRVSGSYSYNAPLDISRGDLLPGSAGAADYEMLNTIFNLNNTMEYLKKVLCK